LTVYERTGVDRIVSMVATATTQLTKRLFTVADFERMIGAGIFAENERVELIDGEVVTMAPIGRRHFECVLALNALLTRRCGDLALVSPQSPLSLGELGRPEPDLALLYAPLARYRGRLAAVEDTLLLVEVAESSLAGDREEKVPRYARAGVPETWLVNLIDDAVLVYREPSPEGYRLVRTARRGDTIAPLAFPDWTIPVDEVLPAP
jgi:Uma2 family endonuclease